MLGKQASTHCIWVLLLEKCIELEALISVGRVHSNHASKVLTAKNKPTVREGKRWRDRGRGRHG